MYLLIVFVFNMDSLNFLILILNLCILWINLDCQIFIKSNGVYSSLFWINVRISRSSRRTWWLLLTLKYKDNRCYEPNSHSAMPPHTHTHPPTHTTTKPFEPHIFLTFCKEKIKKIPNFICTMWPFCPRRGAAGGLCRASACDVAGWGDLAWRWRGTELPHHMH
jgi:hypothetical protein